MGLREIGQTGFGVSGLLLVAGWPAREEFLACDTVSYLEFKLESRGACVPLRLARGNGAVCVGLRSSHFVQSLDWCKCGRSRGSEVGNVDPEEDLQNGLPGVARQTAAVRVRE